MHLGSFNNDYKRAGRHPKWRDETFNESSKGLQLLVYECVYMYTCSMYIKYAEFITKLLIINDTVIF